MLLRIHLWDWVSLCWADLMLDMRKVKARMPAEQGNAFFQLVEHPIAALFNLYELYFNVAFKPVATIMQDQATVDKYGNETNVSGKGRHDPCVVPRAVPIVEAMAALVLADFYLRYKISKLS